MTPHESDHPLPLLPVEASVPQRWGRTLACLVVCVIGLLVGRWIIDSGISLRPEGRLVRGKSSYLKVLSFRETKDEYDVVFLGSSRVQRGIHPEDFDARMEELGRPVRSFNFGLGGIRFPETVYWVDWILAQRPEKLRWFFIELQPIEHWIQPVTGWRSRRFLNWHGWSSTRYSLGAREVAELEDAAWRGEPHLTAFLRRSFNIGNGIYTLREAFFPDLSGLPRAGYDWTDASGPILKLGQGWQNYQSKESSVPIGRLTARGGKPGETPPLLIEVVDEIVAKVEAHGIVPIFFHGPAGRPRQDLRGAFRAGLIPTFFAYEMGMGWELSQRYNAANPGSEKAPEDFFSDSLHLNVAGAHIFGGRMAEDFHAYLETRGAGAK